MKHNIFLPLIFTILCIIPPFSSASGSTTVQLLNDESYSLTNEIQYRLDPSNDLTINSVITDNTWQNLNKSVVSFGFIKETLWLKFDVQANKANDWYLQLAYPLLDYVDNYSFINGSPLPVVYTGDLRAFSQRPVDLPYHLSNNDKLTVYLKISTSGSVEVPTWLKTKETFSQSNQKRLIMLGWINGILVLMFLYNLFIYFVIRDKAYLYYVINVAAYLIALSIYDGYGFQYFWPLSPNFNNLAFPVFNGLIQATSLLFMLEFLKVFNRDQWYKKYFIVLLYIAFSLPILGAILPYRIIVPVEVIFAIVMNLSGLTLGAYLSIKGDISARYFTLAWSVLIIGLLLANLKSFGLLPTNWFTAHAYQLGAFIETFILSLALAQKIESARKDRNIAQKENLKSLNRFRDLYNDSLSGQFQVILNGNFLSVNPTFAIMLGYSSPDEFLAQTTANFSSLNIKDHQHEDIEGKMLKKAIINNYELEIEDRYGKSIWIALFMRPTNNNNEFEYYEGSTIDISESVNNSRIKDQAFKDRMITMEQLIAGICHELNTPLGVVTTGLSHLKDINENTGKLFNDNKLTRLEFYDLIKEEQESIDICEGSLLKTILLINKFKTTSIGGAEYIKFQTPLGVLLQNEISLLNSLLEKYTLTLSCDNSIAFDNHPKAVADVIHELILNSVAHGFDGVSENTISINVSVNNNIITIIYSDSGKGMREQDKQYVFNPFYTTGRGSNGKTGLGMYHVHNIINQLLKGKIAMLEKPQGVTYSIDFPQFIEADSYDI